MIYIIFLILSFSLTFYIKNFYIKNALLDEINERSSHTIPTPHGGGIAIAITWFFGLFYLAYIDKIDTTLFYALMVGLPISVVSFFDDIYDLSPKLRMAVQSIVALLGIGALGGVDSVDFFAFTIENQIFTNIFAFLLIVWFINLYNFLDGINGYAGSQAVFLALAGFFLFGGDHFLLLVVSVLGFLFWNYGNAKIFMGDVGSTLLGYNIAIFTLYYTNQDPINMWVWIILFGLFWVDATVTLVRRKLRGEKLSQAHKKHAYQRLNQSGWSHFKIANYALGVNALLFLIAIACLWLHLKVFVGLSLALILLLVILVFIEQKRKFTI